MKMKKYEVSDYTVLSSDYKNLTSEHLPSYAFLQVVIKHHFLRTFLLPFDKSRALKELLIFSESVWKHPVPTSVAPSRKRIACVTDFIDCICRFLQV